jgi:parallel beta-helix repeat protein
MIEEEKMKRILAEIMLILLLIVTLALAFNVQPVKASGTIYIRADGSIDPQTANITTLDKVTYTFIGNVNDFIVVERNSIIIDGVGFTVEGQGEGYGIDLSNRSYVTVKNVRITNFSTGAHLAFSNNNNITNNDLLNNIGGIFVYSSNSNVITNNRVFTNMNNGISLNRSNNNTIAENYLSRDNIYGITLAYSCNNTLTHNNITNNTYGMYIHSTSENSLVVGNNVSNCYYGINLNAVTKNTLVANNLYNNNCGICLWNSHNSTYANNNILNNSQGIDLGTSRNNLIFHNNFVNNDIQASVTLGYVNIWDNDYPSGGNYWSNYMGVDFENGISQNETGSDGIGDSKYIINQNNTDGFPLMAPLYTFDAGIWAETNRYVEIISNSTISNFRINMTEKTIRFNAAGETGMGFCRIIIPNIIIQTLWLNNYAVLVNGLPIEFRNWTDTENTYIYVNYTHSEHEIIIVPEFPSAIILTLFMVFTMLAAVFAKKRVPRGSTPKSRNMVEC